MTTPATTARKPLNGATILSVKPVRDGFIVCVQWRDEYVTAWTPSLSSPEWSSGSYFRDRDEALAHAANRH